ncbi:MAG TPA: hypothetical protein VGO45_09275 [Bacteroidia bacterium]|nr:hypothetical protein [Bacteroidia bacterium]
MTSFGKNRTLIRIVQVALHVRNISAENLMADAQSYLNAIATNKRLFQNPRPPLSQIRILINELSEACAKASSRGKTGTAVKTASKRALEIKLKTLAQYVEAIANDDPEHAIEIVQTANMRVKKSTRSYKQDFSMKRSKRKGELILSIKKTAERETYRFEISTNPDFPSAWQVVQQSTRAKAVVRGLVSGTRYYARVFRTDKTGTVQVGTVLSLVLA